MAGYYDITIKQGSKFILPLIYKDANGNTVDLTTYSAAMQGRKNISDSTTIFSLTSGGEITLGAAGQIDIEIAATATAVYDFETGLYDLKITPPSGPDDAIIILEGKLKLSKEVTRS